MRVPEYRQLTALRQHLLESLQSDSVLAAQLGCSPDQIVARVVPRRLYERGAEGVGLYTTEAPIIGVFPTGDRYENVEGMPGHETDLGIQYLLKASSGDAAVDSGEYFDSDAKMVHILNLVWDRICAHMLQPSSLTGPGNLIASVYPVSCDYLPQLDNGIVGIDATAVMEYRTTPYQGVERTVPMTGVYSVYEPYQGAESDWEDNFASGGVTDFLPGETTTND